MRRDIDDSLALLAHIEEPLRALQWRAGNDLGEVMHTLLGNRGIFRCAVQELTEQRRLLRQGALQGVRDLATVRS